MFIIRWVVWVVGFIGIIAGLWFLTEKLWIGWTAKTGPMSGTTPITVFAGVSVLCVIIIWVLLIPSGNDRE